MMTHRLVTHLAGVMLAVLGCQSIGVSRDELPEQPIAFIYHSEGEARQRAESVSAPGANAPAARFARRGIFDLNALHGFLGDAFGSASHTQFEGRLAFLNPRSSELTLVESARKGAIPQDWSADRNRLLFAQRDSQSFQLYEFDRRSGAVSRLTRGPDRHPQGCYGPDGRLVVVVERVEAVESASNQRRWVSRIGLTGPGDEIETLSAGPLDADPACAPDGTAVAYARFLSWERSEIQMHYFTGDDSARAITRGRDPAFTPDSQWIVYSQRVDDKPTLWRIRRDGVGRARLGMGSGTDEYGPAVSPDGSLVVYESVLGNRYRLFLRRLDGTGDRVLFSAGDGTHAVW
jgi:Tol biopolymer transport system component